MDIHNFIQVTQTLMGKKVIDSHMDHFLDSGLGLIGLRIINRVNKRRVWKWILVLTALERANMRPQVVQRMVRIQNFVRETVKAGDHDTADLTTTGTFGGYPNRLTVKVNKGLDLPRIHAIFCVYGCNDLSVDNVLRGKL